MKPTKKIIIIASTAVVIIGVIVASLLIWRGLADVNTGLRPDYKTALPSGTSIEKLGGWERVSPPGKDSVFAFTDKIGDVSITVSEQPLPASFKSDVSGKVAELAKAYSATNILDAKGTKAYIGTSAKGPQSTIFTKNELLILIKSQAKISDDAWIAYINSLK